ncbi:head-tail adaptor protein [Caballeronia sp. LZ035]|uniref:head-tail adaptor protein n=1 Tax=Caballeronia sp. LZ035 TaxID=3038568 RepID=UPI00285B85D4|nr:head-tail adaptor protein [Caballeronia sp. LZ035]MDR5756499.1 head-tail adaptor protein [Caballeronia sp. LZ035]
MRIERRVLNPDGESFVWELVASTRASVIMQSGKEIIVADAPISLMKASVRIRYSKRNCEEIHVGMQLTVDHIVMRIEQVQPDLARHEHVQLVCISDDR